MGTNVNSADKGQQTTLFGIFRRDEETTSDSHTSDNKGSTGFSEDDGFSLAGGGGGFVQLIAKGVQKGAEGLGLDALSGGPVSKDNEVGDNVPQPVTRAQFRDWASHGPKLFRTREAALDLGINYSLMMREAQDRPARTRAERNGGPPETRLERVWDELDRRHGVNRDYGPRPSDGEWAKLFAREQAALANYDGPIKRVIGDSNTEAPAEIWSRGSDEIILNQGISGDTTADILGRIRRTEPLDNEGLVLLSGGTNDLKNYYDEPDHPNKQSSAELVADIIQNKRDAVRLLKEKNPNGDITLAAVIPSDRRIPQSVLTNVNRQIEALAKEMGVGFVDPFTPLAGPDNHLRADLTNDGIHPTGPGFVEMGWASGIMPRRGD